MGLSHFKFFPAETSGGLPALKALAAPLHMARFCPTGGITAESAPKWLAEPLVKCVGGSWVVPKGPVDAARTEGLGRAAAALPRWSCGGARRLVDAGDDPESAAALTSPFSGWFRQQPLGRHR